MHIYAYTCVYIYLSSCQSINLSFQSHLMIVVRWVLCLWEQQSIWIALPSGLAVPSCICIFPCIGICLFLYFWSRFCRRADTIVENTQCSLGIAILWVHACLDYTLMDNSHLDYRHLDYFGIQGHADYRHFDYLWRLDYRHLDYFGLQGPADYRHLDYYDVWTIAVRTILDYRDILTIMTFGLSPD